MINVLAIDVPMATPERVTATKFRSGQSVLPFDVVIWWPAQQGKGLGYSMLSNGSHMLDSKQEHELTAAVKRRAAEFMDFCNSGKTLIVFASGQVPTYCDVHARKIPLANTLEMPLTYGEGNAFEVSQNAPASTEQFLNSLGVKYTGYFPKCSYAPLAFIRNTKNAIGYVERLDSGGKIIVLPETPLLDRSWTVGETNSFLSGLEKLIAEFDGTTAGEPAPHWVASYQSQTEKDLKTKQDALQETIRIAERRLDENLLLLSNEEQWKGLFYQGDAQFEELIIAGLNTLGIPTVKGVLAHVDAIAYYRGCIFAIEAKGRETKGAARKNITQCRTWVLEIERALIEQEASGTILQYQERLKELGIEVPFADDASNIPAIKGVLIINGYRNLPLEERIEPVFHTNMVDEITINRLCAMTGLSLYDKLIRLRADKSSSSSADALADIFSTTNGVIETKATAVPFAKSS